MRRLLLSPLTSCSPSLPLQCMPWMVVSEVVSVMEGLVKYDWVPQGGLPTCLVAPTRPTVPTDTTTTNKTDSRKFARRHVQK